MRLGLLDHPTGVGLRYGLTSFIGRDDFLGSRTVQTHPAIKQGYRGPRSTLSADLPTEINVLRVPRAIMNARSDCPAPSQRS